MSNNQQTLISNLSCAVSPDHFFNRPLILSCGHNVCEACVPKSSAITSKIQCKLCENEASNQELLFSINKTAQFCIEQNLNELFKIIKTRIEEKLTKTKDIINEVRVSIDSNIKYIKDEIDIRIESLKVELDMFGDKLKEKASEMKNKIDTELNQICLNSFDNALEELSSNIEKNKIQTSKKFYEYQDMIKRLDEMKEDTQKFEKPFLQIHISGRKMEMGMIGSVEYTNKRRIDVAEQIEMGTLKYIESSRLYSMCYLENYGCLLASDYLEGRILVYDKELNILRNCSSIDNLEIAPIGITCNNNNEIFIADYGFKRIIKTNIDFSLLASYQSGNDQKIGPSDLCYFDEMLYVCDFDNKKILLFDRSLVYKNEFKFEYSPWYIEIFQNTACIRSGFNGPGVIYFYNVSSFDVKYKYEGTCGFIGLIGSHFYEYFDQKFNCYDHDGKLIRVTEKRLDKSEKLEGENGKIVYFDGKIIISTKRGAFLI